MSVSCPILKSIYNPVHRIIVIGDIHGDYRALLSALRMSGLISKRSQSSKSLRSSLNWIGGTTHLVQLGDIFDRHRNDNTTYQDEKSELKIYKLLFKLQDQALHAGGCVHLIIGNHELMNLMGNFRYVSVEGHQDFQEYQGRRTALGPGGAFTRVLACRVSAVVKIGDLIFSHAGITYEMSKKGLKSLNQDLRKMLLTGEYDQEFLNTFWHREFSGRQANCQLLDKSLYNLQGKVMIVGHTVQNKINSTCDGKIWRTDIGMSSAFGRNRKVSVLEIINGQTFNVLEE